MICGHCKERDVNVLHVKACSTIEQGIRAVGAPQRRQFTENTTIEPASLAQAPVEGIYLGCNAEVEGAPVSYYKVVQGTNTGNWYAKRWDGAEWVYKGRKPLHFLTAEDRISAEDAARFGHVTGQCVFCSRRLTDDGENRSVAVGYGPVCAAREGLPWG